MTTRQKKILKVTLYTVGGLALVGGGLALYLWFAVISKLNPIPTQRIDARLFAIRSGPANVYVYRAEGAVIAFDAGNDAGEVRRGLSRFGLRPADVTHVFLSHGDADHVAALASFDRARVFMSADEEQMLNGKKARAFGLVHNDPLKVRHERVRDGQEVRAGASTVRCLATPGHTPGSMSFLLDGRILYAGDNLRLERGRVKPFVSLFNLDGATQASSIHRLAKLRGVTLLLTAHTGYTRDVEAAFRGW